MSSVRSNFVWNTAYQVVRILTPLITMPYLARVLGSESLGIYSYTYTIANYFTYFCLLGLGQYGNREIAKAREDRGRLSRTFWSIFAMQLSVGVLVVAAYLFYVFFASGEYFVYSLIWGVWVLAEVVDVSWFFYGMEEFRAMTIRNLLVRVCVIVGIFVLVRDANDLWVYCALQAVAFGINSWVLWAMMPGRVEFVMPTTREVLMHVRPNLTLFAPVIAISVYTQFNEIVLGNLGGMCEVAYYDNAYKIVVIPLTIISSLGTVMLPRMSSVIAKGERGAVSYYLNISFWLSEAMAFGLMFGIVGVAPEFVPVFFGGGFDPCRILMPLLAVIIPVCAWSSVLGNQYLIPHEKDGQYLGSVLVGSAVDLGFCAILVPSSGAYGAAVATVFAELFVSLAQSLMLRREVLLGRHLLDAIPFVAVGVIEYAVVRFIGGAMGATVTGVACQVIAGATSFFILSFAWLKFTRDQRLGILLRR